MYFNIVRNIIALSAIDALNACTGCGNYYIQYIRMYYLILAQMGHNGCGDVIRWGGVSCWGCCPPRVIWFLVWSCIRLVLRCARSAVVAFLLNISLTSETKMKISYRSLLRLWFNNVNTSKNLELSRSVDPT